MQEKPLNTHTISGLPKLLKIKAKRFRWVNNSVGKGILSISFHVLMTTQGIFIEISKGV